MTLIEVRGDPSVSVLSVSLSRIAVVVVEMEGEVSQTECNSSFFEFGECSRGNEFVWSGGMVLCVE